MTTSFVNAHAPEFENKHQKLHSLFSQVSLERRLDILKEKRGAQHAAVASQSLSLRFLEEPAHASS